MSEPTIKDMVDIVRPKTVSISLPEKMPLSALLEKIAARAAEMEKQLADIAAKSEGIEALVDGIVEKAVDKAMETATDEANYYTDQEIEDAKDSMTERVEEAAEEASEKYVEGKFVEWLADKNFKVILENT